jgi:hypothetical protein
MKKWSQRADSRVVDAVIATFRDSAEHSYQRLGGLTQRDWARSALWMDASGMALYFLNRVQTLGIDEAIPTETLERLLQKQADNRLRCAAMLSEFCSLNEAFQAAGVQYANVKGFTLSPDSCPDPALRLQVDFDFMVDGDDLSICREILEERGYVLTRRDSTKWQFEAGSSELARREDLYKPRPQRSIDLHFTCSEFNPNVPTRDKRLDRRMLRAWHGHQFPVLSPADQFAEQAMHLLRHLRSPGTRPSWLLEYRRHMSAHFHDEAFWHEVERISRGLPNVEIAIGLATMLSIRLFGGRAPAQLNEWTLGRLPAPIRLWANLYGRRAVLADGPGTKLHLLLEGELARGTNEGRKKGHSLLSLYRMTRICYPTANDSLIKRVRQEYIHLRYFLFRIRFQLVEGYRIRIEQTRWKRRRRDLDDAVMS